MPSKLRTFLAELKRRRVYQVAAVYIVVGLGVLGAAEVILDPIGLGALRPPIVILVLLGLPIALVLAWAYEIKPEEPREEEPTTPAIIEIPQSEYKKSIIVLPFDNISPDPNDAYFSDGLTEEIITNLSYLHSLRVISRNSAMVLKGTQKDTRTIAAELDVQYVLEGSVRKEGEDLRITAQLIDATHDEHLWAEKYEGRLENIFDVQERIARSIVEGLKLRLSPTEEKLVVARPIADPHAYDTWVLAMHEGRKFTKDGIDRAIHLANEALAIVGDSALLHAALGYFHWGAYDFGISHDDETLLQAEKCASRALELDPNLPQALYSMGLVRYKRNDIRGFVRYAKRAVELAPDGDALGFLAFVLAEVGRISEARQNAEEALARDPLIFFSSFVLAAVDIFDGQFNKALNRLRDARERLAPREPFAGWWLAQAAAYAGEEDEARAVFEEVAAMKVGLWSDMSELFRVALEGDQNRVHDVLDNTNLREMANTDEYYPLFLANALTRVGDTDEALRWLEQAISWGFTNHRFLSEQNRFLEDLRDEERFQSLIVTAQERERAFSA